MKYWLSRMRTVRRPGTAGALLGSLLLLSLTGACTTTQPSRALDAAQPSNAPVRNIDNFNEALRCMDRMFAALGKRDIYITTAGIPDATGLIAAGTKEMFISAVSQMSDTSGAFRFVDYDPTQTDVQILSELVGLGKDFVAPNYYVRGAITQLDSGVLSASSAGGSVFLAGFDLAARRPGGLGDLGGPQCRQADDAADHPRHLRQQRDRGGGVRQRRQCRRHHRQGRADLQHGAHRSEGFAQAVRTLVDLSTIEVLGKLTHVPYLGMPEAQFDQPRLPHQAREWFDMMGRDERDNFVRTGLTRAGYLPAGPSTGDLSTAIARYQSDNDLIANGRVDFDLYYRLLAGNSCRPGSSAAGAPSAGAVGAGAPGRRRGADCDRAAPAAEPPAAMLATAAARNPSYRVGENMSAAGAADPGCLRLLLLPRCRRRGGAHLPQPLPAGRLAARAEPAGDPAGRTPDASTIASTGQAPRRMWPASLPIAKLGCACPTH